METAAVLFVLALLNLMLFGALLALGDRSNVLFLPLVVGGVLLFAAAVSVAKSQEDDAGQKLVDSAARIVSLQRASCEESERYLPSEAALQESDKSLGKIFVGEEFFIEEAGDTLVFELGSGDQALRVQMEDGEVLSVSSKDLDDRWQWPDDLVN